MQANTDRISSWAWIVTRRVKTFATMSAVVLLSACSGQWATDYDAPLDPAVTRTWRVSSVEVMVPDTLTVSDENSFAPSVDIVWHGDPPGDRRAQISAIIEDAARRATEELRGGRRVSLSVTVAQFHAVTPIAVLRAPGAVHNIIFAAQVFDAAKGTPLTQPTMIQADLPALVGEEAFAAAQIGQTQKVRVTDHLIAVFKGWLGIGPDVRGTFESVGR